MTVTGWVRVDCHLHTADSGDAVTSLDQLAERVDDLLFGLAERRPLLRAHMRHPDHHLAPRRVAKVTDVVKEGDQVKVQVLGVDDRGKVRLSMKQVDQTTGEDLTKKGETV